ncbi:MAG: D-aminoacyl-tRNA deacylase, partial [Chloroflexota bacterium]
IGSGLFILVGVAQGDTSQDARFLADKVAQLRIFPDEQGRFNLSSLDTGAELLVVSQFTLFADTRKGRRPSFSQAAPPSQAQPLIEELVSRLRGQGFKVETGQFGEHMLVEIHNQGPVTIILDSQECLIERRD